MEARMPDKFTVDVHLPGLLAADANIYFVLPEAATLVHVSAVSTAGGGGLTVGTRTNPTCYLAKKALGTGGSPLEFDFDDFSTYATQRAYPHIAAGTTLVLGIDYDYVDPQGTSPASNVTVVLTFVSD
jgi:hypothetical protein